MKIQVEATGVFEKLHNAINGRNKIVVLRGGTRSSKTFSVIQTLFIWLVSGKIGHICIEKGVTSIVRKFASTLRGTVQRDLEEVIDLYEARNIIEINKTERTYKYRDRMIEFFGADDQQKLRGGKRNILYCNEANELRYKEEFFQLNIRTKNLRILDFNPDDEDIRINTELEQVRKYTKKDVAVIVSTYKDNPFLSSDEVSEIEHIKEIDPYLRQVYGKGEYGKLTGAVYDNREIIESLPKEARYLAHGMDFGYTNDPTAVGGVYEWNGGLVIDEEFYKNGLLNTDIDKEMNDVGIPKGGTEIFADSSEPKSIEELYRLGWNIKPVVKGPDSIIFGINVVKRYKLYITARSINTIKEIKKYKRKEDKTGKSLNVPIDEFNHAMDAIRYACMMKLGQKQSEFVLEMF